jgi:hypothetical protein
MKSSLLSFSLLLSPRYIGHQHLLSQVTVLGKLQEGNPAGLRRVNTHLPSISWRFGFLAAASITSDWQTGQIGFIFRLQAECIVFGQQVFTQLQAKPSTCVHSTLELLAFVLG